MEACFSKTTVSLFVDMLSLVTSVYLFMLMSILDVITSSKIAEKSDFFCTAVKYIFFRKAFPDFEVGKLSRFAAA